MSGTRRSEMAQNSRVNTLRLALRVLSTISAQGLLTSVGRLPGLTPHLRNTTFLLTSHQIEKLTTITLLAAAAY